MGGRVQLIATCEVPVQKTHLFLTLALSLSGTCQAEVTAGYIAAKHERKSCKIGTDVAIFAYPLVMMDLARQFATYTSSPLAYQAPINQFAHEKELLTPLNTLYLNPNVDTLSSN